MQIRPLAFSVLSSVILISLACGGEDAPDSRPESSPPSSPSAASSAPAEVSAAPALERVEDPPALPLPPERWVTRGPYTVDVGRECDGYPFVDLQVEGELCVGLVLTAEHPLLADLRGRFRPRTLLADPLRENVVWLVDAGPRRSRAGRLFRLLLDADGSVDVELVSSRLDRPHGLRLGPDGKVYVGEISRIVRFDPRAGDVAAIRASREEVVAGIPSQLRHRDRIRFHPLKSFVFTPNGDLIVNQGSGTDHCAESLPAACPACERCEGEEHGEAGLWRFPRRPDGTYGPREVVALGLRNSVALAAHSSGTVLQAENGTDFPEGDRPHEELNVIREGRHYGWPYCYDTDRADERWSHVGFACDTARNPRYQPPQLLLPPHGAPLDLLYTQGALPSLRGLLLVPLHGYRATGHRILAFAHDARGIPAADAVSREIVGGWAAGARHPRGAPVGLAIAPDGAVWIAEDRNGTVLRLARDAYAGRRTGEVVDTEATRESASPRFIRAQREVLVPRCSACHGFVSGAPAEALARIQAEGWLARDEGDALVWLQLGPEATRPMPPTGPLMPAERELVRAWLDEAATRVGSR